MSTEHFNDSSSYCSQESGEILFDDDRHHNECESSTKLIQKHPFPSRSNSTVGTVSRDSSPDTEIRSHKSVNIKPPQLQSVICFTQRSKKRALSRGKYYSKNQGNSENIIGEKMYTESHDDYSSETYRNSISPCRYRSKGSKRKTRLSSLFLE